jgi:hypothetical protein
VPSYAGEKHQNNRLLRGVQKRGGVKKVAGVDRFCCGRACAARLFSGRLTFLPGVDFSGRTDAC